MVDIVGCFQFSNGSDRWIFQIYTAEGHIGSRTNHSVGSLPTSVMSIVEISTLGAVGLLVLADSQDVVVEHVYDSHTYAFKEALVMEFIQFCSMQSASDLNEIDMDTCAAVVILVGRLLLETYIKLIKLQVDRRDRNVPAKNKPPSVLPIDLTDLCPRAFYVILKLHLEWICATDELSLARLRDTSRSLSLGCNLKGLRSLAQN